MTIVFDEYEPQRHALKHRGGPAQQNFPRVEVTSRDRFHSLLQERVSLNRYDAKFLMDITTKYLAKDRKLSEGQNELWEKIVHKYRKQLKKQGVYYKDVFQLKWDNGIKTNAELREQTKLDLYVDENSNETMVSLAFNFDKKKIDEVRAILHDDGHNWLKRGEPAGRSWGNNMKYQFNWNPDIKEWRGPFNPHLFRDLYYWCRKHKIRIGENAHQLIMHQQARLGRAEDWRVRSVIRDGRIYVNAISEALLKAISDEDMTDTSLANLEHLANKYGVAPPTSLDSRTQALMTQARDSEADVYQITNDSDMEVLVKYLDATDRRAMFNMPSGKIDSSIVSRHVTRHDMGLTWNSVNPFGQPRPNHALVASFGRGEAKAIMDGHYDTIVSNVPFNVFFTMSRGFDEVRSKIKKYIHVNDTGNNPN